MKTTIKAILINIDEESKNILNDMMLIFGTAERFAFKRLLEGMEKGDLEKCIAAKYKLNIRQAKDAVEKAREMIESQRKLVRLNYDNYTNKVRLIEKTLQNKDIKLTDKKRNALV